MERFNKLAKAGWIKNTGIGLEGYILFQSNYYYLVVAYFLFSKSGR
jgi:hypothetical protein